MSMNAMFARSRAVVQPEERNESAYAELFKESAMLVSSINPPTYASPLPRPTVNA